jgi:hypothetical protein
VLTVFSIPKPFRGHIGIIQYNAIRSWALLHPDAEVILFGDEPGTAEACRDLRVRHEPEIVRNQFGTPLLNHLFGKAQGIARHDVVCYSNCDIILAKDFTESLARVAEWRKEFLMVGRRWDLNITEPLDFSPPDWSGSLQQTALHTGCQRQGNWIDYFAFRGDFCKSIPPFAVGRTAWDNWLIWNARHKGAAVVDASAAVAAVHQNHDYNHHPQGEKGVWEGEEARTNRQLAGGLGHLDTIQDAPYEISAHGIRRKPGHLRRTFRRRMWSAWFALLNTTRELRHAVGLRHENVSALRARIRIGKSSD